MPEPPPELFFAVLFFLTVPFAIALFVRLLKFPPVIGYILGGILLGNLVPGIRTEVFVNQFAFFGILLLMFTIGLEVNFEKMLVIKKYVIAGGILQIGITAVVTGILSYFWGFNSIQSVLLGLAFSLSSTTLVAKLIQNRGEETSFIGELAIGILMLQDLAFIPLIIIFTYLKSDTDSYTELFFEMGLGMVQAVGVLTLMYLVGKRTIGYVFNAVARLSRELLNVFIIIFIFFVAYICTSLHIPIFIGIFIAGVVVSQTREHYHIFSQVRPMRDILSIIFFIFIGTHIDLMILTRYLPQLFLFSMLIMIIKSIIILSIFLYFKFNTRIAATLAILLFQVSEGTFILLTVARSNSVLTEEEFLFVISSILISIVLTPILVQRKETIYRGIRLAIRSSIPSLEKYIVYRIDSNRSSIDALSIKDHVVICGYGRVGAYIGRALTLANIPFIAIDYNFHVVQKARSQGVQALYGDPTDRDILDFAEVEDAVALVSVVPDRFSQEAIVLNARKLKPDIVIMSRIHKHDYQNRLKDLGVDVIVQPEFEASLSIIRKLYYLKHVSRPDAVNKIRHFKLEQGIV